MLGPSSERTYATIARIPLYAAPMKIRRVAQISSEVNRHELHKEALYRPEVRKMPRTY